MAVWWVSAMEFRLMVDNEDDDDYDDDYYNNNDLPTRANESRPCDCTRERGGGEERILNTLFNLFTLQLQLRISYSIEAYRV
jgi:hypothetical protein